MNRVDLYHKIISNASGRIKADGLERHHIAPRCVGGNNEIGNLGFLTRREHFICHKLISHLGDKYAYSFLMLKVRNKCDDNSRSYEARRKIIVEEHKKYRHSDETRAKMTGWNHTEESKERISEKCNNRGKSPWEVTNANSDMWLLAGDIYLHWKSTGEGYIKIMRLFGISQMTAQTMTRKFQAGWIPFEDVKWTAFSDLPRTIKPS